MGDFSTLNLNQFLSTEDDQSFSVNESSQQQPSQQVIERIMNYSRALEVIKTKKMTAEVILN